MPYITPEARARLDSQIDALIATIKSDFEPSALDGVLNFTVSRIVGRVLCPQPDQRYWLIARAVAVFECAKLELYRRLAGPYEDTCIKKNGDIPEYKPYDLPPA